MSEPLTRLGQRPFTTREALSKGLSKAALTRMVKTGVLDRLSRGVYQVSAVNEGNGQDLFKMAALRCGSPSAICLLSALENYQVTDQIARRVWVLVPESKRVVARNLKLIRSRNPHWRIGIRKYRHYWITTLERTLVDCLLYRRIIGAQVALAALRRAITEKKANLGRVHDVAKRMRVLHRVEPYLEALAA